MAEDLSGKKIAFLVANSGVEEVELTTPWDALRDAGADTVMIAPERGEVQAFEGDVNEAGTFEATLAVADAQVDDFDALVLPGGESTTMAKLARTFDLLEPLRQRIKDGMPALGTCAGMILLANRIEDGAEGQETVGGLDITVRRNAFGRQVHSFEGPVDVAGLDEPVHGIFIRAPWVEDVGDDVEVLARVAPGSGADPDAVGRIVAVRQGPLMATSFHPEVGGDARVHELFVRLVRDTLAAAHSSQS